MIVPSFTIASLVPVSAVYINRADNAIPHFFFLLGGTLLLIFLFLMFAPKKRSTFPFPPGPEPLPLVGNLFHINTAEPWLTYTAWKKKYGDLVHVRLLGQHFIILNSEKVARALLEQRSSVYSNRPIIASHSLFGMDFSTVMLPYGDKLKLHRKIFQHAFRAESEAHKKEIYSRRMRTLLTNLLDAPTDFEQHLKSYVASNIMALAYGYQTADRNDPIIRTVTSLVDLLAKALSPERSAILSAFPFLEKLPGWFPGSGLWRDASYGRKLAVQVVDVPFNWVKDQVVAGSAPPSMVADCLSQLDEKHDCREQEDAIKSAAATAFIAGFETSSSTLHAFVLAMLLCPDVQARAQAEIDAVLGHRRLPNFDDRPSLPYVDAILRELVRWNPVVPLGIPHATSSEDVYEGYYIPKGALLFINVWAIGRDKRFTDVEEFRPERFLNEEGKLRDGPPMSANPIFGLGRRICPGRFASEAFMWLAVVSILATFRITNAKDAYGKVIEVQRRFTTGVSVRPVEFPCWFISRSNERVAAIRERV